MAILLFSLSFNVFSQGYKIEVKIKGTENQKLILGHHKNGNLIPDDTTQTDSKGYGVFKGDEKLRGGMYFIFLEKATYFDIIIDDDQEFSLENDTTDLFKNLSFKGSPENQVFLDYQNFLIKQNEKLAELKTQKEALTDEKEKAKIDEEMQGLTDTYYEYYENMQTNYPDMFFSKFLKATRQIEVPETITDKNAQYYYYRFHYFDNFDYSDPRMLFTPIYEDKINNYLDNVLINHYDTLISECDILLENTKHDDELYKYMMIFLFNKYAKSQLMAAENVYVHLGYKYIETAVWDTDSFKTQLKPKLDKKSKCLIGKKGYDIKLEVVPSDSMQIETLQEALGEFREKGLEIEKDETKSLQERAPDLSLLISDYMGLFPDGYINLYNIDAKYTILWFMEPDCSHCKKETPVFYKEYVETLKDLDVEVCCIYLHRDIDDWNKFCNSIDKWLDFIQKNEMYEWYNLWNPFDLYRDNYDINSSPVLFLLDENKTIIGKRIGHEQATEMIKSLEGVE